MGMDCYTLDKELKELKSNIDIEIAKMKLMFSELYGYIAQMEKVKSAKKEASDGIQSSKKKSKSKAVKKENVLN